MLSELDVLVHPRMGDILSMLFLLVEQANVKVRNGCTAYPQTMETKAGWTLGFQGTQGSAESM